MLIHGLDFKGIPYIIYTTIQIMLSRAHSHVPLIRD